MKRSLTLHEILTARFGTRTFSAAVDEVPPLIGLMVSRGSCRVFLDDPVPDELLDLLFAAALSSPTKSDLQQRDIILLRSPEKRRQLADLVAGQSWVSDAPMIAVFCGNNRRQRLLHEAKGIPFANDHLDALFNAIGDAAIALGAFVTAAEAVGLGCCPVSAVRNEAAAVSKLLKLPDHVFPFAGLAFGYPASPPDVSMRLPLQVTIHSDEYCEDNLMENIQGYDQERALRQPYKTQRFIDDFGEADAYSWSDDKVRQYSKPERAGFGDYIRARGFNLD